MNTFLFTFSPFPFNSDLEPFFFGHMIIQNFSFDFKHTTGYVRILHIIQNHPV